METLESSSEVSASEKLVIGRNILRNTAEGSATRRKIIADLAPLLEVEDPSAAIEILQGTEVEHLAEGVTFTGEIRSVPVSEFAEQFLGDGIGHTRVAIAAKARPLVSKVLLYLKIVFNPEIVQVAEGSLWKIYCKRRTDSPGTSKRFKQPKVILFAEDGKTVTVGALFRSTC